MRQKVGFIRWQDRAEEAQILEFTEFAVRRRFVAGEGKCEGRLVAKQAEEDEAIVVDQVTRQASFQQDRLQRITTDEASILPDRDEPAFRALDRPGQPVPILAPLSASLDEGAGEYIGILHPDIPI
jgi:hypothetical protein